VPIGDWVHREACAQQARWQAARAGATPPRISVNLSRVQLMLPDLPGRISEILESTGTNPAQLHLEITESAIMRDQQLAIRTLRKLRELGLKLDLDDFGTGYSSLASLHLFPLDVLKIDRSFVANIGRGRDFAALVHAVSQLARNLGIAVVAEGIETPDQLQMLQALDCQFGQGYLFSKPLPADRAMNFSIDLASLSRAAA
jgi:EAL domain-containing protein (putative c-di-GMP-specific phosphodiesterase class I)